MSDGIILQGGMMKKAGGGAAGPAWALVASSSVQGGFTPTPAIDTTGANLIVITIGQYDGTGLSVTDNKGNVFNIATESGGIVPKAIFYCANPVVGSGHTFQNTRSSATICVAAFSGASIAPLGAANVVSGAQSANSITPTQNNSLIVATGVYGSSIAGLAIDAGFTIVESEQGVPGSTVGCAMATLVQDVAAAVDPTWSGPTSEGSAIAEFKPADDYYAVTLSHSPSLLFADTGADTSIWEDLSSNGRHVTQANAAIRPAIITNNLNGRQIRRFTRDNGDGAPNTNLTRSLNVLDIMGATTGHIFLVSKAITITNDMCFQLGSWGETEFVYAGHGGNQPVFAHAYSTSIYVHDAVVSGPIDYHLPFSLYEFWRDGANMGIKRNGVTLATTAAATGSIDSLATILYLGGPAGVLNDVAMIATYPQYLGTTAAAEITTEINTLFFP